MTNQLPENNRIPPDHTGVLISAVIMILFGAGGLFLLVRGSQPRLGAELWLFFMLLHLTITGFAIPIMRYLNVRFTRVTQDPPPGGVIVRQSVWIGLFVVVCAWMQILRVLSLPIVFFLALVFLVLEIFLRTREISAERE